MNVRQDAPSESTVDVHADGHGSRTATLRRNGIRQGGGGVAEKFKEQPVLNTLLVVVCIAAIVLAYTTIGPASQSSGQSTRTTTVKRGVVQSTVSGSGNIQSAHQLNLGFKTSGTVTHIYVRSGQHVTQGQLLATLDPKTAEVTLEQAKATLQSAEANLAKEEESEGETSSSQGSSSQGSSGAGAASASPATTSSVAHTTSAAATTPTQTAPQPSTTTTGTGSPTTTTAPSSTPTTSTTPAAKTTPTSPTSGSKSGTSTSPAKATETSSSGQGTATSGRGSTTKQSAATREANLASAKAAVKSDKLTVQSDEQAVQNTRLYAPEDGTIVSLSGEVGETVSGTGTTRASSSTSASSGSSSSGGGGKSPTGGGTGSGSSSSAASSSSTSSSSSFAVLSNLESLQVVVALSESEIGNVHVGQIASVTIEALSGRKVAAHVVSVSQAPTSTSGAVSYDVTFQLDQGAEGLKVGMSATAEVVVKQAEGLNVATSAIKAGSVTILRNGKQEARPVTTGLAGDSSTIVLSGLKAGEVVVLPTSASSGSSLGSGLGSRSSRGGGLGGGLGGGGFGGGGGFPAGGPPGG